MTDKAYAVPLHEQLASVPRDARLIIDDPDGRGTRFIPVGRMCHEAAEALRARLAQPEPEPVAWMHNCIAENVVAHRPADLDRHPDRWTALYKDPTPCQTCEALARTVMMDQTSHDTRPPRGWQGLTKAEREEISQKHKPYVADIMAAHEEELKRRNT